MEADGLTPVALPEPARPSFRCRQGEDIEQLGEPALHLPVPSARARLCDAAATALESGPIGAPTRREIKVYSSQPSPSLTVFLAPKSEGGLARDV